MFRDASALPSSSLMLRVSRQSTCLVRDDDLQIPKKTACLRRMNLKQLTGSPAGLQKTTQRYLHGLQSLLQSLPQTSRESPLCWRLKTWKLKSYRCDIKTGHLPIFEEARHWSGTGNYKIFELIDHHPAPRSHLGLTNAKGNARPCSSPASQEVGRDAV